MVGESSITSNNRCGNGSTGEHQREQAVGDEFGLAADRGEEVIIVLVIVAHPGGCAATW